MNGSSTNKYAMLILQGTDEIVVDSTGHKLMYMPKTKIQDGGRTNFDN